MEDETLSSILSLLQGSGGSNNNNNNSATANNNNTNNNTNNNSTNNSNPMNNFLSSDMQSMLLKMFLSGGFNNFLSPKLKQPEPEEAPAKPRTINLENYKRLD